MPDGSVTAGANSPPRVVSLVRYLAVVPVLPVTAAATGLAGTADSLVPLLRRFSVEATVAATLPGCGSLPLSASSCLLASLGSFSSLRAWPHGRTRGRSLFIDAKHYISHSDSNAVSQCKCQVCSVRGQSNGRALRKHHMAADAAKSPLCAIACG